LKLLLTLEKKQITVNEVEKEIEYEYYRMERRKECLCQIN